MYETKIRSTWAMIPESHRFAWPTNQQLTSDNAPCVFTSLFIFCLFSLPTQTVPHRSDFQYIWYSGDQLLVLLNSSKHADDLADPYFFARRERTMRGTSQLYGVSVYHTTCAILNEKCVWNVLHFTTMFGIIFLCPDAHNILGEWRQP